MNQAKVTKTIDPYSFAARPALFCFGNQGLGVATVFFWYNNKVVYLITNWHNVTGVNPITNQNIHQLGGRPTKLEVTFLNANQTADYQLKSVQLFDDRGVPLWKVHKEHNRRVDVVALPIKVPEGYSSFPINEVQELPLKIRVGHELFVIGFPFFTSIFDRGGLPIWKRASLASEPEWVLSSELYNLVDTASRPGMSGSPVVRRAFSGAELDNGSIGMSGGSRFFGVYAGRMVSYSSEDAQLGRVYERRLVEEIVSDGVRDTAWEKPPGANENEELISLRQLDQADSIKL